MLKLNQLVLGAMISSCGIYQAASAIEGGAEKYEIKFKVNGAIYAGKASETFLLGTTSLINPKDEYTYKKSFQHRTLSANEPTGDKIEYVCGSAAEEPCGPTWVSPDGAFLIRTYEAKSGALENTWRIYALSEMKELLSRDLRWTYKQYVFDTDSRSLLVSEELGGYWLIWDLNSNSIKKMPKIDLDHYGYSYLKPLGFSSQRKEAVFRMWGGLYNKNDLVIVVDSENGVIKSRKELQYATDWLPSIGAVYFLETSPTKDSIKRWNYRQEQVDVLLESEDRLEIRGVFNENLIHVSSANRQKDMNQAYIYNHSSQRKVQDLPFHYGYPFFIFEEGRYFSLFQPGMSILYSSSK